MRPDEERLVQYYQQKYLPEGYWHPFNQIPFLYQRQQQKILRAILMSRGIRSSDTLSRLNVLDAGCGNGKTVLALVELGADPGRITGVDLIPGRIDQARAWTEKADWRCHSMIDADLGKTFDIIIVFAVLSSMLDGGLRAEFMRETLRHLDRKGTMIFYDMITSKPESRSENYRTVGRAEFAGYVEGMKRQEWRRSYLRPGIARRLLKYDQFVFAELLQSLRLFNSPSTFIAAFWD